MRFKTLPCIVVLCLTVCTAALGDETPSLQRISEHVYAYVGIKNASPAKSFGANAGLVVGRDAALVIDTLTSAKEADRFIADVRKITDKPVKFVVNTHYHLDHAWGNCQFVKLGAIVISHENARPHIAEAAKALAHPESFGLTAEELGGTVLSGPTITFTDSMIVDLGNVAVELRYPGPSHTNDSITAHVPQDKVIFVGDILFTHYHAFLGEGDLASWQRVLTELEQMPGAKIIPGHGPVSGKSDLENMKIYLDKFDALARSLSSGRRAEDAPVVAQELIKNLPQQQRVEMPSLVEYNLRLKYLKPAEVKK